MKIFEFKENGNLKVTETAVQEDGGAEIVVSLRDIDAAQIASHLPMFQADMTAEELAQAQAIIAAQGGA